MVREKISEFIRVIDETQDSDCLDLIEELVASASEYVHRVNVLEIAIMIGKYNKNGEEYRTYIENLDKQRNNAHNILISNVKIINRLCRSYKLPLIYQGNEEERIEVAEFAQQLVNELFSTRRL